MFGWNIPFIKMSVSLVIINVKKQLLWKGIISENFCYKCDSVGFKKSKFA